MVSVKIKKQLTLPQLIEWAWENDIWSRQFCISTRTGNKQVSFGKMNEVTAVHNITEDDLFTVEVEEVVDSDTVLDNIYTVNVEVGTSHTTYYKSKSINDVKTDEINIVYTILQEEAIVLWDSQGGFR